MTAPTARTIRFVTASVALVALSGITLSSLASSALFTDSKTTGSSAVTSGTVTLALGGTAATTLAVSAMAPGDAKYGVVTVQNAGSLQSRYSSTATWSASNALTTALTLSARTIASAVATCDGTLTWGTADVATNVSPASSATTAALFGNPNAGAQAGDRTVSAATSEYLCIRLALPSSAGNAVGGLTSNLTLTFDAEQTANNA
jgi:hypothetical protein